MLKGSLAYSGPLYHKDTFKYTKGSDVYSFSLILLQVVCGAKEVDKVKAVARSVAHEDIALHDTAQLTRDENGWSLSDRHYAAAPQAHVYTPPGCGGHIHNTASSKLAVLFE